jgi:membrane protein implicated in regulation of membrane protease activity
MPDWAVWVLALSAALLAGVAYLLFWRWLEWKHEPLP